MADSKSIRLIQTQKLQQKLSPLQIQTIKMLEIPTVELQSRIERELEENPMLEEVEPEEQLSEDSPKQVSVNSDDPPAYRMYVNNRGRDERPEYNTFSVKESFQQSLERQLGYCELDQRQRQIAMFIVGMLSSDGYLRDSLETLADKISFRLYIETDENELEGLLKVIQTLEPVGIGARSLEECLLIQLRSKTPTPERNVAVRILEECFEELAKKHYSRIMSDLEIDEHTLKSALTEIVKLNPHPGGQIDDSYDDQAQQVVPDFVIDNNDGELSLSLPRFNVPELRINQRYADMIRSEVKGSSGEKEANQFVKDRVDRAKWFIEAIKQRHNTLRNTMQAILDFQHQFFLDGDETKLRPMVLKDIAAVTGLDISTVSRVVSSKYVQTQFGIFPLKYFFSEGLENEDGVEVSTREIKKVLSESIADEDKRNPLTDEKLVALLAEKGYVVARRTVAKYREQLGIPIARMRRSL